MKQSIGVPSCSNESYLTDRRQKIHNWLEVHSPSLAELYSGVLYLIFENRSVPGRVRFISHGVREIRNGLNRLEKDNISDLNAAKEAKKVAQIFFVNCIPEIQKDLDTLNISSQWWNAGEKFMEKAHDNKKVGAMYDEQELLSEFEEFELFLGSLSQIFYSNTDELDKILEQATIDKIGKAVALLVHPQQRHYFFDRLENPEWISELKKRNWFNNPPSISKNDDNTVTSFPSWAESRYLARMAVYKPEEVLTIALNIKTDNPRICIDFVKAALAMPPDIAADLNNQIKRWIGLPYSCDSLADQVGELISHLAKGEQIEAALKLVRELLAVFPNPSEDQHQRTDISYRPSLHPRSRFNEWHYNRILKKNIPDLVAAAQGKALPPLCGLLQDAIKLSNRPSDQQEEGNPICEDNSNNWRPSIEDNPTNFEFQDIKNSLVTTIKDSAQQIIAADSSKLREIIVLLRKCRWRVFYRLAIHLLRQFPKVELSLVAETLIDHNYFDYPRFHQDYEYALLARDQFVSLSIHDQKVILDWINNPVLEQSSKHDLEESLYWIKRWQVRKLTPLKSSLSDEWQQKYTELVNDVGSFELTDLLPAVP